MNISKTRPRQDAQALQGHGLGSEPDLQARLRGGVRPVRRRAVRLLVGDYYFDQSPPDVELLGEMAKTSAAAHCPFIAAASPTVMQMGSWQELANPARSDQDLHDAGIRRVAVAA